MATITSDGVERQVDFAHTKRLSKADALRAGEIAEAFLDGMTRNFSYLYLHLDVDEHKEQNRHRPQVDWKALFMTDHGRFYAEAAEYGAIDALKKVLDEIRFQVESKLGKEEDAARQPRAEA